MTRRARPTSGDPAEPAPYGGADDVDEIVALFQRYGHQLAIDRAGRRYRATVTPHRPGTRSSFDGASRLAAADRAFASYQAEFARAPVLTPD